MRCRFPLVNLFTWLQNFRRMIVRYERKAKNFYGFVELSALSRTLNISFERTSCNKSNLLLNPLVRHWDYYLHSIH